MIIVKKNEGGCFNASLILKIFKKGSDVVLMNTVGRECCLGEYGSPDEARIAFEIMLDKMETGAAVIRMPTDKEVQAKIVNSGTPYIFRSMTGRKAHGHGRS